MHQISIRHVSNEFPLIYPYVYLVASHSKFSKSGRSKDTGTQKQKRSKGVVLDLLGEYFFTLLGPKKKKKNQFGLQSEAELDEVIETDLLGM